MNTLTRKSPGRRPLDEALTMRRQEEILDAAAKVFAQYGYPETDLQVIADALGVAKGTIYRYFPSKRELFLASVDRGMKRLKQEIDVAIAGLSDPLAKVQQGIASYFDFFDQNPEFVELIMQERAVFRDRKKPTYFEHCEDNVEPWRELFRVLVKEGRIRRMPVERITDVLSNLVYGTMFTNYFAGGLKSLESQTQDIMDILLNGILRKPERSK